MKRIQAGWYLYAFVAVMGFTAGAATNFSGGYIDSALEAIGQVDGLRLLGLAADSMLVNAMLFCWCSIVQGGIGKAMSAGGILFKSIIMGMFCRELIENISGIKMILAALTVIGGCCICVSMAIEGEECKAKAKRIAIWISGAAAEGIIIPSVARTWALLFS